MRKPLLLCLSAWMLVGIVEQAQAQRQAPSRGQIRAGRAENAANGAQGRVRGGGNANGGSNGAGNNAAATPNAGTTQTTAQGQGATQAQAQASEAPQDPNAVLASRAAALRELMNAAGITETPTQDAIIGFIFTQERARQPLLKMARSALAQINQTASTQAGGLTAVVTDDKVLPGQGSKDVIDDDPGLVKYQEYARAIEADTARYNADLQKLDGLIGYTSKPRIEAFLALIGVLNNDTYGFGGPPAVFAPGPDLLEPQTANPAPDDDADETPDAAGKANAAP